MSNRAYKFRIYPNLEQEALILRTFGCARFCWNVMLEDLRKSYQEDGKFTIPAASSYKIKYPFLKEVDSIALGNVWVNINRALSLFLNGTHKPGVKPHFPKWKSKKHSRRSYTTNVVQGKKNIRIEKGKLRLPKIGLVKTVFHRRVEGKIKSVTVSQDPSGKFYASILVELPERNNPGPDLSNVVGLDFNFHHLVVTSDGARIKHYPRWFREMEKKLVRAQRKLSRKENGSSSYNKQKLRVARIHESIRNKRLDFLRKIAKRVLDNYDVIVVEDINLQGMSKKGRRRRFGSTIMDLGFGILRSLLQQGAQTHGKLYVKADRWFPSSQLCNVCGTRNPETKNLNVREWTCANCKTHHDRDVNAAKNLAAWFSTGAAPGSYADGDSASTLECKLKGKQSRRTRKSCRAVDPASHIRR